jgi:S-adenosylmethionine synthetase
MVDTQNTGLIPNKEIEKIIRKNFDLSPYGIIEKLDLLRPIFCKTASYGHFGRENEGFVWENRDSVNIFKL